MQGTSPNGDYSEQVLRPTFEDAFTLEYKALHDAIVNGTPVKTSPLDCELSGPEYFQS